MRRRNGKLRRRITRASGVGLAGAGLSIELRHLDERRPVVTVVQDQFRTLLQRNRPIITWGGFVVILALTLYPGPAPVAGAMLHPLWHRPWDPGSTTDFLWNVLLFVPLGIGLTLYEWRSGRVVVAGFLLSIGIESLQLGIVPGRDPTINDVLANTAGALLGIWVTKRRDDGLPVDLKRWQLLRGLALIAPLVGWFVGVHLVRFAPPPTSQWFVQWQHLFGGTVALPGQVVWSSLNEREVPDGPLAATPSLRAEAEVGGLRLSKLSPRGCLLRFASDV